MDTNQENQSVNSTPSTSQAHKGRSPLIFVMGGILIFVCGLGIGWYVGSASRTPTIVYENNPVEMTDSNITPTASTEEQMYTSDKYGFSFTYPAGIVLTDANPDWLTLEPTSGNWYISIQFSQENELSNDLKEDSTMQELTQENILINGSQAKKTEYYPVIEGKKDSFKLIRYEIKYPEQIVTVQLKSSLRPNQQLEYSEGVTALKMIVESMSSSPSPGNMVYQDSQYPFSFRYPQGFSPNDDIYDLKVITDKTMEQYLEKYTETLDPLGPTTNYAIEDLAKSTLPGKVITKGGVDVSKTIILDADGYLVEFNINMIQFDPDTVDSIVEQVKTIARTVKITL